jgi:hypothetical protein
MRFCKKEAEQQKQVIFSIQIDLLGKGFKKHKKQRKECQKISRSSITNFIGFKIYLISFQINSTNEINIPFLTKLEMKLN